MNVQTAEIEAMCPHCKESITVSAAWMESEGAWNVMWLDINAHPDSFYGAEHRHQPTDGAGKAESVSQAR